METPQQTEERWRNLTPSQLNEGADSGMRGSGCITEAMRRLQETTEKSAKRMERLTKWLIGLTVALFLFTVAIAYLTWELANAEKGSASQHDAAINPSTGPVR